MTIFSSIKLLLNFNKLKDESDFDQLTGLLNKNTYRDKITEIIKSDPNKCGALVFFDVNNLKYVNEKYGHLYGDEYLVEISNSLRIFENYTSVLARPWSDEFVVYIHGFNSVDEVKRIVNSNLEIARESKITVATNNEETARFSSGVAIYPTDATDADNLIKYSDFAMSDNQKIQKGTTGYFNKIEYSNQINEN